MAAKADLDVIGINLSVANAKTPCLASRGSRLMLKRCYHMIEHARRSKCGLKSV